MTTTESTHTTHLIPAEDPNILEKKKFRAMLRIRQIYSANDLLKYLTTASETPTYIVEDAILYLHYKGARELTDDNFSSIKKLTLQLFLKVACLKAESAKNLIKNINEYVKENKDTLKNNQEKPTPTTKKLT